MWIIMTKHSEHLQWIHDRIVNVYGENKDIDFLIRFRIIIADLESLEEAHEEVEAMIVLDNSGSLPEPKYLNKETGKVQRLFCEETLIPVWNVRYEDPYVGNKGEAVYMTVSAKDEKDAKTQALACTEFSQHITPSFYNARYLTAFKAEGNYKIGEVQYFEGDPRL